MSNKNYNFNGKIMDKWGSSIHGYTVELIKTNPLSLEKEKALDVNTIINSDGTFNIDINENFDKKGVILRVLDANGTEVSRTTHHKVKAKNEMNIKVEKVAISPTSFMGVGKLIDAQLDSTEPKEIKKIRDSLTDEGITLLAEETKVPFENIKLHLEAEKIVNKNIPPEFNFSLLNAGIKKEDLFTLPLHESMEIYKNEIEKNGIKLDKVKLDEIKENVLKKTTETILTRKSFNSISSVGEMLDLTTEDVKKKEKILNILFHSNDEEAVKERNLKAELSSKMFEDFQFHTELGTLTFNNAPLIKKLKKKVKTVEGLVDVGLYEETVLTSFVKGTIEKDKEKVYISTIIKELDKKFPERILAREIRNEKIPIKDKDKVLTNILSKKDFKLAQKGISQYEEHFKNITDKKDREEAKNELGKLNRVFALTNNRTMMKTLLDKGFDSAFKIVNTGQNTFINIFEDKKKAKIVFQKSQKKVDMLIHLFVAKETTGNTPMPHAILSKDVKKNPDLEKLFGDLDFCSCGHCESVLSPAAYLVDLLEFLKDDEVVNKLLAKRPDIEHIELTCANTETVLPYIDLVNEVLEYWVVNSKLNGFKGNNVDNKSSESLLAEPAHVQDKVYEILAKEIFPLNLPFDRNKKLEQSFFSSVGISRLEILNLLNKESIDDKVLIQEKLNMNEKLYEIFTKSEEKNVAELYGFDNSINLNETLSNAKLFCRHLELEYEELIRLLKTKFINADKNVFLIYEKVTDVSNMYVCNFSELKITKYRKEPVGGDTHDKVILLPLEKNVFFELILFIRLYKHIGWSIEDVDLLSTSIQDKNFHKILLKITFINDLKNLLSLSDNRHLFDLLSLLDKGSQEGKKKILASFLKIDVLTLEDRITLVGIKPFEWTNDKPLIIDFIQKMKELQSVGVELSELNYLFRDIDKTGKNKITIDEIMTVQNLIFEEFESIDELSEKKCKPLNEAIKKLEKKSLEEKVKTLEKEKIKKLNTKISEEKKLLKRLKKSAIPKILSEHLNSDIEMIALLLNRIPLIENNFLLTENDISVRYSNKVSANPDTEIKKEKIKNINFEGKKNLFPQKTNPNADYVAAFFSFPLETNKSYELMWEVSSHLSIEIKIDDIVQNLSEKVLIEANRLYDIKIVVSNIKNSNDLFQLFYKREEDKEKKILSSKKVNKKEYGQLLKSLQWINKMNLTLLEAEYFMQKETIEKLPILEDIREESSSFLVSKFLTISKYQKIKEELNIINDDLVKFLLAPSETYLFHKEKYSTFYQFVSWEKEDVERLLEQFSHNTLSTLTIDNLFQYTKIFILSTSSGLSIDNLLKIANGELTVEKLKDALNTKYDSASWLKFLKNTYNPMRTAQRDALVSYILSKLKSNEETEDIKTQDKLFEYFLIDVAMDSCMKTSRIKQAISSIQLFIQRCLYNLEAVSPSSINLEKWEWAKNYRVWEANRKLFLYPENWLDPSLRSSKTPFFKELEGELLQADINEDLATKALLTYLEKVDKVSHLEVCGMCKEEDSERIHVIGRTSGIKRVYYHRVYDGTWTPWEQIVLDLEDGPVIPVFWKGRLFLYWITTLQKAKKPNMKSLKDAVKASPKHYVEVNLNWSEYYNDKWQEKRTSDFNEAVRIDLKNEEFNKNHIKLEYLEEGEKLLIGVNKNEVYYGHYTFFNTQSLPETLILNKYQVKVSQKDIKKDVIENQEDIELLKNEISLIKNSNESKEEKALLIVARKENIKYFEDRLLYLTNLTVMKFSTEIKRALSDNNQKLLIKNNYKLTEFANPKDCISSAPFFINDRDNSFFVQKDTMLSLLWIKANLGFDSNSNLLITEGINHD